MNVLAIGDIAGSLGRSALRKYLPELKKEYNIEFVIANVDNIAHGIGFTKNTLDEIEDLNIDVFTGGNHIFDKKDQFNYIDQIPNLLRPMNFPKHLPGKGFYLKSVNSKKILVIHIMGQVYMSQNLDDPFNMIEEFLNEYKLKENVDAIFVDFHAEATAEKYAMGHMMDGKVTAVFGTHTHVPTSDFHILSNGSAYITDLGMCGNYDSVIGMQKEGIINNMKNKFFINKMEVASDGEATFCAALISVNETTGLADDIKLIQRGGVLKSI